MCYLTSKQKRKNTDIFEREGEGMKKITETFYCDICKTECKIIQVNYPVLFYTEQTEGRSCKPYISYQKIEVCPNCCDQILKVSATGAQGFNDYKIIGGEAND